MARTVSDIQTQITGQLVANFSAVGITVDPTKWSKRNMLQLLCFTFATCAAYLEQLMDVMKASIETVASQSAAASPLWIQAQMFNCQYSSTVPQILQMIGTIPQYPVVDPTLLFITGCSVSSVTPNIVTIKVATGNPFTALSAPQLAAAQGFINLIGTAGVQYTVVSQAADTIDINANVYYQGQYSSIITATVLAAIDSFLQNASVTNFDGSVKLSELEAAILAVTGVNDVELLNVQATAYGSSPVALITSKLAIMRQWFPVSGYVVRNAPTGIFVINYIAQ